MAQERPLSPSTTLPHSFRFNYDENPRTPEPQITNPQHAEPPRPPRLRIRRRRPTNSQLYDALSAAHDMPIPSIETTDYSVNISEMDGSMGLPQIQTFTEDRSDVEMGLNDAYYRAFSVPKTPEHQMMQSIEDRLAAGELWNTTKSFSSSEDEFAEKFSDRPSSSSSAFSVSSIGSMPSLGNATSPESEYADPFRSVSAYDNMSVPHLEDSDETVTPVQHESERLADRVSRKHEAVFTKDMDQHLWATYMAYLQDPIVTPFKMAAGVPPPAGVCVRVARKAKKDWRGPRRLHSATPTTAYDDRPTYVPWPKESTTRNRLRQLCKGKPFLSAHYHRMLRTRTPDVSSSPRPSLPSSAVTESTFETRDIQISLATSTSASMQPGNPLSNLASQATPSNNPKPWSDAYFNKTFGGRLGQPALKVEHTPRWHSVPRGSRTPEPVRRVGSSPPKSPTRGRALRSPFQPQKDRVWHAARRHTASLSKAVSLQSSPPELHAPIPVAGIRSFKRRAQHSLDDTRPSDAFLQDIFGPAANISDRRVRTRGFSMGDSSDSAQRLTSLFTPPEETPSEAGAIGLLHPNHVTGNGASVPRLRSPFQASHSNTFPKSFSPPPFEPPVSFEQRFGGS
jgi:hypothetical protein